MPQVNSVDQKDVSRSPAPPFMTSTLQQEAFNRLGFSPSSTMQAAQQLYEGPDSAGGKNSMRCFSPCLVLDDTCPLWVGTHVSYTCIDSDLYGVKDSVCSDRVATLGIFREGRHCKSLHCWCR